MSHEAQLIAAVASMWTVLTTLAGGVINWLLRDRKEMREKYEARIDELELKLAGAGQLIEKQNESLLLQIQQLESMIEYMQKREPLP